jgi:glycosyltransferase involved in cell wall biosynthesis
MKILVLSPKPPWPPHDGGAVAIMKGVEGLASGGAQVSLLAMKTEKHGDRKIPAERTHKPLFYYETVPVNTRIKPLRMAVNLLLSNRPYDLARFRSDRYSEALQRLIPEFGFDIIQCEGPLFTYYLDEIKKLTSAPVVLRAHNIEHRIREMTALNTAGILSKAYLSNLARRTARLETEAAQLFDAVVPISEPDMQWFSSVRRVKPLLLMETGTDDAQYVSEPEEGLLKIGFIGALNWKPNLDGIRWFLKEVWPCVAMKFPDVTLHIAGRGAPKAAHHWLRGERVTYEGEVDDARVFMASLNVVIAPLFAGSGLRIKIIEAMSIGRTVIATPVAVNGIPAEDRRELLVAADAMAFCSAMTEALGNREMRRATGEAAVKLVKERYDNRANTAQLLEFYKELTHGC